VGRLAVTVGALPLIVPVNYWLDNDVIFVRTGGRKLKAATEGTVVGFEAGAVADGSAWSVAVAGMARPATETEKRRAASNLLSWVTPGAERIAAISIDVVSGRRVIAPRQLVDEVAPHGRPKDPRH
jgi:nitroimidazol reductase NimA-like FMN-containing flavoprotein (pyridoxamine 5'-phosphate oxidase superfamily)